MRQGFQDGPSADANISFVYGRACYAWPPVEIVKFWNCV